MRKFKWMKFFTYLSVGLMFLGAWGYINYTNYTEINQAAQVQIEVNNNLIDETVEDIETEQMELRMVQRVVPPPPPAGVLTMGGGSEYERLEAKIQALEAEKQEFLKEKGRIAREIEDVMSLFKVDVKNPFMNIVLLPLFAYFMKKVFDFVFNRLEERFHHE